MQRLLPLYLRIQIHHLVPLSFSSSSSEVALIVQPGFVVLIQTQQADPTLFGLHRNSISYPLKHLHILSIDFFSEK